MQETEEVQIRSLGWEDPLEEEMATHSGILAWRLPWTEGPGGLLSMGSQRVGYDWAARQQLPHHIVNHRSSPPGGLAYNSAALQVVCVGRGGAVPYLSRVSLQLEWSGPTLVLLSRGPSWGGGERGMSWGGQGARWGEDEAGQRRDRGRSPADSKPSQ